jgi:hypothetical protein
MQEWRLPIELRWIGWRVLLLHDVLEDTTYPLPNWVPEEVLSLVKAMSFENSLAEREEVWERPPIIWLLKAYDKASNLMDGSWMDSRPPEYRQSYRQFALELAARVKERYGDLNIVRIIHALCQLT